MSRAAPESLVREARQRAGLTQEELADRMSTTQSAIARLEAPGGNPRIATLSRALAACERDLTLASRPHRSSIDETLVARSLRTPPGERIKAFERAYTDVRRIALAGRRARGELA